MDWDWSEIIALPRRQRRDECEPRETMAQRYEFPNRIADQQIADGYPRRGNAGVVPALNPDMDPS